MIEKIDKYISCEWIYADVVRRKLQYSVGGAEADCSGGADVVTSVAETEGNFTWPSLFSLILTEQDNF